MESTPLATAIPIYCDKPVPRSRNGLKSLLWGTAFLFVGTTLLVGGGQDRNVMQFSTTARSPQTVSTVSYRGQVRLAATVENEEEELTVGDLLRGKAPQKKDAPVAGASASALASKLRLDVLEEEEKDTTPKAPVDASLVPDSPWQTTQGLMVDEEKGITRISFGVIGLVSGLALLTYGFGAYFQLLPGESASAVMLIYGFPASLIGFALKYAELKPLVCRSTPEGLALRDSQATDIQKQVREDVTRYRYGDEKHLEEAIDRIFQLGRPDGVPRNAAPTLIGVQEQVIDGQYALILEFENNPRVQMKQWVARKDKFKSFFGPGIRAELGKTEKGVDVALICDGTGAGRDGKGQADVLPPLMPGLPARRQ